MANHRIPELEGNLKNHLLRKKNREKFSERNLKVKLGQIVKIFFSAMDFGHYLGGDHVRQISVTLRNT